MPFVTQAPLGPVAALAVLRAPLEALQDRDDRVVKVLKWTGPQDREPSSNNRPRHLQRGQGRLVRLR